MIFETHRYIEFNSIFGIRQSFGFSRKIYVNYVPMCFKKNVLSVGKIKIKNAT